MKKIVFIEPKAPGGHIFSRFALPRIGIFILGTMMKNRGWNVEIVVEDIEQVKESDYSDADIVGISTITPTAMNAYKIADEVKKLGIPVIMGGPHVTFEADEALAHSDFVIRGEGELPLMKFMDAWENGDGYDKVPNLSYRRNGKIIHNPLNAFESNLDQFPLCDFTLIKSKKSLKVIPIQTSRGCPYDCSFCSVTGMFGKKYRFRSTAHIIEELRSYKDSGKFIFFYDDHFGANKKRAKELLEAIIRENLGFKWSTQIRVDVAKDLELLRLMKKAGCHTLFIGIESFNPESLKEMKKHQTVEEIINAMKVINSFNINIHGMFVHGFDQDTWESVKTTLKFAKKLKISSAQFLILTPFPGSEFYAHVHDRIVSKNWSLYDAHHVVYKPNNFSIFDLQMAQLYSHEKFYSAVEITKRFFRRKWISFGLSFYARYMNMKWKIQNRAYLSTIRDIPR
jgi:radical SAM superfamily enzyme YgiQ (UPF0313 family)